MQRFIMMATALMLTACSAPQTALPPVKPPANALTKVAPLPAPRAGDALEAYLAEVIDGYYQCAIRHDALRRFYGAK